MKNSCTYSHQGTFIFNCRHISILKQLQEQKNMVCVKLMLALFAVFLSVCSGELLQGSQHKLRTGHVAHTENFVAFSTGLTHSIVLTKPVNVTFDRIFLNMGNGYDNNTGVFTCPHSGTYNFVFHALSQQNEQLQLDLYRNNEYIVTGYAHTANDYREVGNHVILALDEYDEVYLRGRGTGRNALYGAPDEVYTTFNGFMVIPDVGRTTKPTQGNTGSGVIG